MRLFQPDPHLIGLELLLDPAELLRRMQLMRVCDQDTQLSISNIRYKPNTSCLVSYHATSERGKHVFHAKAFHHQGWGPRRRKYQGVGNGVFLDPEAEIAVFQFPFDSRLRSIGRFAADPRCFLSRLLPKSGSQDRLATYQPLAYKPNRRFVAKLVFESGRHLTLKLHDAATFRVAQTSHRLTSQHQLAVPGRVGRSNRHRALAYDWVEGRTLKLEQRSSNRLPLVIDQVCEYLGRLNCEIRLSNAGQYVLDPKTGLASMANYLAVIYPPAAPRIRPMVNQLLQFDFDRSKLVFVHGDFHEQQIIETGSGLSACDFDKCGLGDATTDLANFVAHIIYRAAIGDFLPETIDQTIDLAIQKIQESAAAVRSFRRNLLASLVRLVSHPFRSGSARWQSQTESILDVIKQQMEIARRHHTCRVSTRRVARETRAGPPPGAEIRSAIERDPAFEFLNGVFCPETAARILGSHAPCLAELYGSYRINDVVALRHKFKRRCMVEFKLATAVGPISILGKVSAKCLNRRAFETQHELYFRHGFDSSCHDGISVPKPIGVCSRWQMWLQEKTCGVAGEPLLELGRLPDNASKIARGVAKLHGCELRLERQHSLDDELAILEGRLLAVIDELPQEGPRIRSVLDECMAAARQIKPRDGRPIHRDFYHDQILISKQRIVIVDLDLMALGHPGLDVGNFVAHLCEHGVRKHADGDYWRKEEQAVVESYLSCNPQLDRSELEAFKLISFARHISISWQLDRRRAFTKSIIDTAVRMSNDFSTAVVQKTDQD